MEPLDVAMSRLNKKAANKESSKSGQSRAKTVLLANKKEAMQSMPEVNPSEPSNLERIFHAKKEQSIPTISVTSGKASI